jgi:VanZ family protein
VEAILLLYAIRWPGRAGFTLLRALAVTGALAAFGTADETHQAFIPGRSMDPLDCAMDTAGAAGGTLVAGVWERRKKRRLKTTITPPLSPLGRGSS